MHPNIPPPLRDSFSAAVSQETVHDAAVQRKFGKFMYSVETLNSGVEMLRKIYEKVIPVDIQYEFARQVFTVTAISDEFDSIEHGDLIPIYTVMVKTVQRKNGKKAFYIKFDREN